jgi:hypothetical protein
LSTAERRHRNVLSGATTKIATKPTNEWITGEALSKIEAECDFSNCSALRESRSVGVIRYRLKGDLYRLKVCLDSREAAVIECPTRRFPPAAGALERELSGRHFDLRRMARDSAGNLFENIPHPLTRVSRSDSGTTDDDANFHSIAHLCTS